MNDTLAYDIIQTTINSFDFTYCIIVNILTYLIIRQLSNYPKYQAKTKLLKRVVLLCTILLTGVLYYAMGKNIELLINSAILAPVAWSFVFKPICKLFRIDYKDIDKVMNDK